MTSIPVWHLSCIWQFCYICVCTAGKIKIIQAILLFMEPRQRDDLSPLTTCIYCVLKANMFFYLLMEMFVYFFLPNLWSPDVHSTRCNKFCFFVFVLHGTFTWQTFSVTCYYRGLSSYKKTSLISALETFLLCLVAVSKWANCRSFLIRT